MPTTAITNLVEQAVLNQMRAKASFTALDISNHLKGERYPVQHREVAETVREIYESGAMHYYDYERETIPRYHRRRDKAGTGVLVPLSGNKAAHLPDPRFSRPAAGCGRSGAGHDGQRPCRSGACSAPPAAFGLRVSAEGAAPPKPA